jgi:hypothetical protein
MSLDGEHSMHDYLVVLSLEWFVFQKINNTPPSPFGLTQKINTSPFGLTPLFITTCVFMVCRFFFPE